MKVHVIKPGAIMPAYATSEAACFDFFACVDAQAWPQGITIAPGASAVIGTGVRVEVPSGHALMLYSRYGPGYQYGVRLANATSIIGPDCTWEVMVSLRNDGKRPFAVQHGDRIAQAMLIQVQRVDFDNAGDATSCSNSPACAS